MRLFLMNDQNNMFGYTPPIKNLKIEKLQSIYFYEYFFIICHFLFREYNLFSQNTESSLEQ